ncbi:MAG: hypothetical protein J6I62_06905 [Selenomonadaceae bacterium]|nr:hypothetical protein [Selenomonadaceae bacterium]
MNEKITSLANEKIKFAASLKDKKYRDEYGLFVGEGVRFAEMALTSDFEIVSVFFEAKITKTDRGKSLIENLQKKGRGHIRSYGKNNAKNRKYQNSARRFACHKAEKFYAERY